MRVFITGASGHIGKAVVADLRAAGHTTLGLARSDAGAEAVSALGSEVRRGDLDDLAGLAAAARECDGVIHLAFKHDIAFRGDYAGAMAAELAAIEAMGAALAGSDKPFVGTCGTLALAHAYPGRVGTEDDAVAGFARDAAENAMLALADRGVRASVVRLAPTVHSHLDTAGFIPMLVAAARKSGASVYVGDGSNRWPAVDTRDAATLYRLAVESAPAGARLHGNIEEGVPFRAIAEAIGRGVGVPTVSITPAEAQERFGFLGMAIQADNPTSSTKTRKLLGWDPKYPDLLADIATGHYFS